MSYKKWILTGLVCYGAYYLAQSQFERISKKLDQIPATISSSLDSTRIEDNLVNKFIDLSAAERLEFMRSINKERKRVAQAIQRLELELKKLSKLRKSEQFRRRYRCGRKKR